MDGGSEILGYEMQIDDGNNGNFITILGTDQRSFNTQVTVTSGIVQGKTYRVRYCAYNSIGSGPWSDIAYIVSATVPAAPPAPTVFSANNT